MQQKLSIRSLFIWVVMTIASFTLILMSGVSLFTHTDNYKAELVKEIQLVSDMISRTSVDAVAFDDTETQGNDLRVLSVAEFIINVHIYRLNPNNELEFFSSYNKIGQPPVQTAMDRVEELSTARFGDGVLEIIRPIILEDNLIGYTYVRASTAGLDELIYNSASVTLLVLVVSLMINFLLTVRFQKRVTVPIEEMANTMQSVAHKKSYDVRAPKTKLYELDILSEAFNQLLDKVQEHMSRQEEAEEEHRRLNASLEEKVQQRTVALKEANDELIQTLEKLHQFQRQMVENEKMASLGDMVAGVAHEVNTPIGLGVTASTMMLDRLKQLEKDFNAKTLKASSLSKFIDEGVENLNIIYRNLNRSAELISSFKQVAVDQSSEVPRSFHFAQLLDEILLSLRPKLKKLPHSINIDVEQDLYVESKAGPINQIMINLIMNSIIHGFEDIEGGEIHIRVSMVGDDKVNIDYRDNGKGIPEHLRKRIFDPFVTTKRGQGGSGLGMHLVYNLVTQALNGSISLASEEGKGVEFQILFPVKRIIADDMAKSS